MRKYEMKDLVTEYIPHKRLFKLKREKCENYHQYLILLSMSNNLLLGINVDDFILDGFSIMRFKDITEIEQKSDFFEDIMKKEGLLENLELPNIRIEGWKAVFEDLHKIGKYIIIENESINEDESEFAIGKIVKVYNNSVHFKHFDADGIWEESPLIIPYSKITTVTFGSRYAEVFSKYV